MGRKKNNTTATSNIFKITSFQPNDCVTSSSIMVEVDNLKILLDLGAIQSSRLNFSQNYHFNLQKIKSIPFRELDYCCIGHFHYDHIGLAPVLSREDLGFKGEILATELTMALGSLITYDAQRINEGDCKKNSNSEKTYYPYYSLSHVDDLLDRTKCYSYNQKIKLSEHVTLTFKSACHCSGASMIYIEYHKDNIRRNLLYTSDITYGHKVKRPFTKEIEDELLKADIVICESTYGKRDKKVYENENPKDFLEKIILEQVVRKNQTLWIPSFAVHRASTLYLYLYEIFENNKEIKEANIPVYFCGQMLHDAHNIIGKKEYEEYYDDIWLSKKEMFNKNPFNFLTRKKDVEHFCLNNTRKIVISSSGMMDKGYSSLLAESYVANKKVSLVFCGYQSDGSLGGQIREGNRQVNVNGTGKTVRLKNCGTCPSLSGHATHQGLLDFIGSLNQNVLKKIILVHGEEDSKIEFKEDLEHMLPKSKQVCIIKQFETIRC